MHITTSKQQIKCYSDAKIDENKIFGWSVQLPWKVKKKIMIEVTQSSSCGPMVSARGTLITFSWGLTNMNLSKLERKTPEQLLTYKSHFPQRSLLLFCSSHWWNHYPKFQRQRLSKNLKGQQEKISSWKKLSIKLIIKVFPKEEKNSQKKT